MTSLVYKHSFETKVLQNKTYKMEMQQNDMKIFRIAALDPVAYLCNLSFKSSYVSFFFDFFQVKCIKEKVACCIRNIRKNRKLQLSAMNPSKLYYYILGMHSSYWSLSPIQLSHILQCLGYCFDYIHNHFYPHKKHGKCFFHTGILKLYKYRFWDRSVPFAIKKSQKLENF